MMTHHSVNTSSLLIKFLKIVNLANFRAISIITVGQTYFEMLFPISLINVTPGAQSATLANTKCPPAAQRKQAKRACYIKISALYHQKD